MIFVKYFCNAKYSFCIYFFIFFAKCATACTLFESQKPNIAPETSGQLVTLNWAGYDSDTYRVQLVANTPEGGVFWSLDTQVKGRMFVFKLPSNHAVVKVQISKDCDDTSLNSVQSVKPISLVSQKKSCSLASEDWLQDGQFIKFKPKNNILQYSLSLYEVRTASADNLTSNLIKKIDVHPPHISMQDDKVVLDLKEKFNLNLSDTGRKYLVSVLPRCAAGQGLPVAFLLN